ncbi:MAG: VCBS domain-containing protein [Rubrivivax sp.]
MTFNANGSYSFDPTVGAYDHLKAGATQDVVVSFKTNDGTADSNIQTLTITVTGTNDAPVVSGAVIGNATEDGATVTLNALTNASDVDDNTLLTVVNLPTSLPAGVSYNAATKSFTLDPGNAAYQYLAQGQTTDVLVSYGVSDGIATTAASVKFTITGSNDVPAITGTATGAVTEDTNVVGGNLVTSGALTISDADAGQSSFAAQASTTGSNGHGTFTLATNGNWTYSANNSLAAIQALNNGQSLTDSFTAVSFDGTGTRLVTVTINGVDDGNALTGGTGDNTYTFSTTVSADSTISDAGGKDSISFTGANAMSKLNFERIGNDLVVDVNNQHVVVLNQYGAGGANTIEDVQFAAGQTFNGYQLEGTYTLVTTQTPGNGNTNWVLAGSSGADTLTGGNNNNQKDLIFGNASGDTLTGRSGNDLLVGGAGIDTMNSGEGNDTLVGGGGNDILTGGLGSDTFVFDTALNASTNVDTIKDFQANATDLIWLSKAIFSGISTVASSGGSVLQASEFAAVASGGATASVGNDVRVIYDINTGSLYYDANGASQGSRALFAQVELAGLTGTVDASDFRVGN